MARKRESAPPSAQPQNIDPIIEGLFARLPSAGTYWPQAERTAWLELMGNAFKLIYSDTETPAGDQ